ncbi:MarC family protein [Salibacteraceae bacterium]|nr:antibiotic resistance protein MarC [Crocinitomicaceae bacterium]MCH9822995.1 MarC family protein [Bacteroidota bacterium]MDB0057987.1 MarC family protein [Salibacteraceae bacterium]|tara:strand:- start:11750 stop:12394 length:645 start_codon:yes stop_codon:yes gene_type:complete
MNELLAFGLMAFTSFLTLLNPFGTMPVFMAMTKELGAKERRRTATKAIFVAFITLMIFAFSGNILFDFFGISVNSLRMVGGIIFFLMGMDMLQARLTKTKIDKSNVKEYVDDISVTPLGIPMICGPGAITNAIVLMRDASSYDMKITLIVSIILVLFITLMILWSSSKVLKVLGETGNKVLLRLMGLIVMVIAVEFFFSGLTPVLRGIIAPEAY